MLSDSYNDPNIPEKSSRKKVIIIIFSLCAGYASKDWCTVLPDASSYTDGNNFGVLKCILFQFGFLLKQNHTG